MLQYKGYSGVIEVDEEAGLLFGRVLGLRDVITFQGATVAEARQAFEDSVDDYLEFCAEKNRGPEKPYSGKFIVRIEPSLHRQVAALAEAEGTSLNATVERALAVLVHQGRTGPRRTAMPTPSGACTSDTGVLASDELKTLVDQLREVARNLGASAKTGPPTSKRKSQDQKPAKASKLKAR